MIKFFRIIRQKLVQENRVGKYLLYAVGEIILVIIGILIALSLNKANEAKTQEKKIEVILRQIQVELLTSIEHANFEIDYSRKQDSLINLVMNRKVTAADYKKPENRMLLNLHFGALLRMQDEGFNSLMLKSEVLPDKYTALVNGLKGHYIFGKELMELSNKLADERQLTGQEQMRANTDWIGEHNYFGGTLPDGAIDYFLNNLDYRKSLSYTSQVLTGSMGIIIEVRAKAIQYIREIDALLETDNNYSFDYDVNDYAAWLGKYHADGDTIHIYADEDGLSRLQKSNGEPRKLYPLSTTVFHIRGNYFFVFNKDERGEILGYTASRGSYRKFWKKIK
jgi:hypothetical protein